MWDNTLLVFHADNGGEILTAGNNYPLRGGKCTNFEGGVRVNAFVNGGALAEARRGAKEEALITGWDWYATYAALAGVDPTDERAAAAGLPAHDSINMWPLISGGNSTGPRREVPMADAAYASWEENGGSNKFCCGSGRTLVGGLIQRRYKLLLGQPEMLYLIPQDVITGPSFPNATFVEPWLHFRKCSREPEHGCLYDIYADPFEERSLAEEQRPELFAALLARVDELQAGVYSPSRGNFDPDACSVATDKYNGYYGPFLL